MLTAAVLGVVGLGISSLNSKMTSEEKLTRHTSEEEGLVAMMRAMVSNSELCTQTLVFATNRVDSGGSGGMPSAALMNAEPGQGMAMCIPPEGAADPTSPAAVRSQLCGLAGSGRPGMTNYTQSYWFPRVSITTTSEYNPVAKAFNSKALLSTNTMYSERRPPLYVDSRDLRFLRDTTVPIVNSGDVSTFTGRLQGLIQSNESGARQKNWYTIASVFKITVDSSAVTDGLSDNPIVACSDAGSPDQLCKQMGCSWDDTKAPKCTCGYAAQSCPAGQALKGINGSGNLICESVASTCPAGQVAVGVSGTDLICEPPGQWLVKAWSPCAGTHSREVTCVHSMTGSPIDNSFCPSPAPVTSEACP